MSPRHSPGFGPRLRTLREERGLSIRELVDDLPISAAYVSLLETEKRHPSLGVIRLLADRLDVTLHFLEHGVEAEPLAELVARLRMGNRLLREENKQLRSRLAELEKE